MSGPIRLQPDPEGIPESLRERDQWICWRVEHRDGEPTKVPIDPGTGGRASTTDPDTWGTLAAASGYHAAKSNTAGIGFVFAPGGPFAGVDLDDCRDPESKEFDEWAVDILDALDTYAEVSPSGTGAHAILRGEVPDGGNRSGDVEMYDSARYFTVTGEHLTLTPPGVKARQGALDAIHAEYVADDESVKSTQVDKLNTSEKQDAAGFDGPDKDLIEKAKNAENGRKFTRLWDGDTSGYPSHSEADLALCGLLAFWTGGDRQRMDSLFRQSGLYREKWDRDDYREGTIDKALRGKSDFYEPSGSEALPQPDTPEPDDAPALQKRYVDKRDELNASTNSTKANAAWKVIRDELDVLSVEPDGEILTCHNGVWMDGSRDRKAGEQELRETAVAAMGPDFCRRAFSELKERVRGEAAVHRTNMGVPAGTIPVQNGLLSIPDRELQPLDPGDHADARLGTRFDADAECPEWEQFIDDVTTNEQDRRLLQEYVGYTLMHWGLPYHKHLFVVGPQASGKSTFLDTVRALIGPDLTCSVTPHGLTDERFKAYQLQGAWANIRNDIPSDLIENAGAFKEIMAGDEILVEQKNRDPYTIQPSTKHLFAANTLPTAEDEDPAFFRRIILVTFPSTIPDTAQDKTLDETLRNELPGILNWALDGLDDLQERGSFYPPGVGTPEQTREKWDSFGKSVKRFKARCLEKQADGKEAKADVYEAYTRFCDAEGLPAESKNKLTRELKKDKDISDGARIGSANRRAYTGFELIDDRIPQSADATDSTQQGLVE